MQPDVQLKVNYKESSSKRVPEPLSEQASAHLDMLRGIAAFAVLFEHWRSIFFVNWPEVQQKNLFLAFFYGSTKYGREAVVIFYVLSGFLIGRSVMRSVWAGRWSTRNYALHRIVRLEIVLVPALLLCWFWDSAGIRTFSPSPTYLGTIGSRVLSYNIAHLMSIRILLGNAMFLQTLLVPIFGSNNPTWSLANEFWYYVLFPCLVISLTSTFSRARRALSALFMIAVAVFIGRWMLGGFLIWLLGAVLVFLPRPHRIKNRNHSILLITACLLVSTRNHTDLCPSQD